MIRRQEDVDVSFFDRFKRETKKNNKPELNKADFEAAVNATYPGLTMFVRDLIYLILLQKNINPAQ